MLKLRRLKIERYRNVQPCELHFHDGFNILLGQNGSGKTTLLKLITSLYRDPIDAIAKDEEFDLEVEFAFRSGAVTARLTNTLLEREDEQRRLNVEIDLDLGPTLKLKARTVQDDRSLSVKINEGPEKIGKWEPRHCLLRSLYYLSKDSSFTDIPLPARFDESLELFHSIHDITIDTLVRRGVLPAVAGEFVLPRNYLGIFMERLGKGPEAPNILIESDHLPFLQQFVEWTGLRSALFHAERIEKRVMRSGVAEVKFGHFKFSFMRTDGWVFPQEYLSYGQKRLLTFLYYLAAVPQVVIADELVNGMHYVWIEKSVEAIDARQAFLTSQNPLLLDCLSFESQQEVQQSFLVCSRTENEGREQLVWRNLTEDEGESFYRAYQVGIQHVGEILRSKGMW